MNNEEVKYPVMQVLDIRQQINTVTGKDGYCLTISDGQNFYRVKLANRLKNMITNGYLTEFAIIYIRRYSVSNLKERFKRTRKVIHLLDLVCLVACPGVIIIGNPKPSRENSGEIVENNIPTSTDAIMEPSVEMDTSAPLMSPQ